MCVGGVRFRERVFKSTKMYKSSHIEIPLLGFYAVKVMPEASNYTSTLAAARFITENK